jgi:predicted RecB family nuclease
MRLSASDFIAYYRPSPCELRIFLRQTNEEETAIGPFDELLNRLGLQHEKDHLAGFETYADLTGMALEAAIEQTSEAIAKRAPVVYQAAFLVKEKIAGTDVEIVGVPDFLILDGDGYVIRDSKISRRVDDQNHPEILLQVRLYGWLFERSYGAIPKALQIHTGTNEIVTVEYDRGVSPLTVLEQLLAVKLLSKEPYEPVGWSKCGGCGFNQRCWAKALANGDVAVVPDIDQGLARKLHAVGSPSRELLLAKFDSNSLSELKRPFGNREQKVGKKADKIIQFATAMETKQETIVAVPRIPVSPNYAMFDLEGLPPHLDELDRIYLWGVQVFGQKPSEFIASISGFGPNGDREGWLSFLENSKKIFETYGDIPFVHWASYEKTFLKKYIDRHGDIDGIAARVNANLLDFLTVARDSVVLPIPSFSLKVIEKYIGFKRSQVEIGGQWAMAKFIEATEASDVEKRKQLMEQILTYNQEDLEATWAVFEWIRAKTPAGIKIP